VHRALLVSPHDKEILMRVNGRVLRPSTLAERRLFTALGTQTIKVPRNHNPYVIARRASRLAENQNADFLLLRELVTKYQPKPEPVPVPDMDTSEPVDGLA
jgi:hypothetical protein